MFDSGIFHRLTDVAYFGYRQARASNWVFRLRRKHALVMLLENYLAWCVGRGKDDFTTYGVPIRYNNNDHDAFTRLYFWFAGDWMYITQTIEIDNDTEWKFMDSHGVKWTNDKSRVVDDLYLCQGCEQKGVKNICYDPKCHHYNDPANVRCRRDFTPLSTD